MLYASNLFLELDCVISGADHSLNPNRYSLVRTHAQRSLAAAEGLLISEPMTLAGAQCVGGAWIPAGCPQLFSGWDDSSIKSLGPREQKCCVLSPSLNKEGTTLKIQFSRQHHHCYHPHNCKCR